MDQRISIPITPSPPSSDKSSPFAIALYLSRFMIKSGASETPIQYINQKALSTTLKDAYAYGIKLNEVEDTKEIAQQMRIHDELEQTDRICANLVEAMSYLMIMSMLEPVACIITFKENNCLIVVGSKQEKEYYVIDIDHNLFYTTETPEYDITQYKYGSGDFDCTYLSTKAPITKVVVSKKKAKKEK